MDFNDSSVPHSAALQSVWICYFDSKAFSSQPSFNWMKPIDPLHMEQVLLHPFYTPWSYFLPIKDPRYSFILGWAFQSICCLWMNNSSSSFVRSNVLSKSLCQTHFFFSPFHSPSNVFKILFPFTILLPTRHECPFAFCFDQAWPPQSVSLSFSAPLRSETRFSLTFSAW